MLRLRRPSPRIALATLALASSAPSSLAALPAPQTGAPDPFAPKFEEYLADAPPYDEAVPKPGDVLGFTVGTWHARPDQVTDYAETLTEVSDRVALVEYARSHEQRPLHLAIFTSPGNHARLEEIRSAHVEAVRSGAETHDGPLVVWMGYGVHGNEPSATNASLLLMHHLAANADPKFAEYLERTIVIVDPCLNPDGNARFAQWANAHRALHPSGAKANRDHDEAWPGGRTNHYWFDLNRDWLLLTHPESRGRVEQFQRWLPAVLTDYHEMGGDSTYFFQPGIPSRRNPITPEENHTLTAKIARFHADALDELGRLYFTEERFDDFYYGKGSTYPDVHGGIGILFEQASARGQVYDGDSGQVTFPMAIQNQFTTSLSTLRAADALRAELSDYQRRFYRDALAEAEEVPFRSWRFHCERDPGRAQEMAWRLARHGVEVYHAPMRWEADPNASPIASFIVPVRQPQYRLLRALFEHRTSWDDNSFYDVSAWSFPESFGVTSEESSDEASGLLVEPAPKAPRLLSDAERNAVVQRLAVGASGWALPLDSSTAPQVIARLHEAGVRVHVATEAIEFRTPNGFDVNLYDQSHPLGRPEPREFDVPNRIRAGSVVVPAAGQTLSREAVEKLIVESAVRGADWVAIRSGYTLTGPDLGSGSMPRLESPTVLLAVDGSVSSYEAGEVWHELDTRVGLPVALVDVERIGSMDLGDFTHVVLVNGATRGFGDREESALRDFVRAGGVLIATKSSGRWAARELMSAADTMDEKEDSGPPEPRPYAERDAARAEKRVAGTIFRANVDNTHPIAFGLPAEMAVFKNAPESLPEGDDPFATPVRYTSEPLVAGFASEENVAKIAGAPAVRVERLGSGTVVAFADDPLFRGVWYGTRPLFLNALFFGGVVGR